MGLSLGYAGVSFQTPELNYALALFNKGQTGTIARNFGEGGLRFAHDYQEVIDTSGLKSLPPRQEILEKYGEGAVRFYDFLQTTIES